MGFNHPSNRTITTIYAKVLGIVSTVWPSIYIDKGLVNITYEILLIISLRLFLVYFSTEIFNGFRYFWLFFN